MDLPFILKNLPCQEKNLSKMDIFLNKPVWDASDWDIYFHNLDIIRASHKLSKGKFNKQLGVTNEYRRDRSRPDPGTISNICKIFNVTPEWLSTSHGPEADTESLSLSIAEPEPEYASHGGWKPRATSEDFRMVGLALEILSSDTVYAKALHVNIQAFYHAIQTDKKMTLQDEKLKGQEARIAQQEGRIRELQKKCDKMERMVAELSAKIENRDYAKT